MSIAVDTIDLTVANPTTGEYLTANVYFVDGVKDDAGNLRPLSIGQLVMALCLQRAAALESQVVSLMDTMNKVSEQLTIMTDIEKKTLAATSDAQYDLSTATVTYKGSSMTCQAFLQSDDVGMTGVPDKVDVSSSDFITQLESKMDEKNSFSQQTMIQLQSLTNKRDQSYDMVSNIVKSLGTVLTGIANNT